MPNKSFVRSITYMGYASQSHFRVKKNNIHIFSSSSRSFSFIGSAIGTLTGIEGSDCENITNMCIKIITRIRRTPNNASPFQEDKNEVN